MKDYLDKVLGDDINSHLDEFVDVMQSVGSCKIEVNLVKVDHYPDVIIKEGFTGANASLSDFSTTEHDCLGKLLATGFISVIRPNQEELIVEVNLVVPVDHITKNPEDCPVYVMKSEKFEFI